jgi:hypothetical protein
VSVLADKERMCFSLQLASLRGKYHHQQRPKADVYHSFSDYPGLLKFFLMEYYKARLKCRVTKRSFFEVIFNSKCSRQKLGYAEFATGFI